MASPKMLKQRLADLEREAKIAANGQGARRLAVEKARFLREIVSEAARGNEAAAMMVSELRADLIKQHMRNQ